MPNIPLQSIEIQLSNNYDGSKFSIQDGSNRNAVTPDLKTPINMFLQETPEKKVSDNKKSQVTKNS